MNDSRRAWAEISIPNLYFNYQQALTLTKNHPVMPIIKANAYGHGAVEIARALSVKGVSYLGVAATGEALELRKQGIMAPILILGAVPPEEAAELADAGVTLTITSTETAKLYAKELKGKPLKCHIKLDSGMSRYGLQILHGADAVVEEIKEIMGLEGFIVEGIYTHFAAADTPDGKDFTALQLTRFNGVLKELQRQGIEIPIKHCANSAAILTTQQSHMDIVREGIILYGCSPDPCLEGKIELRPVMSLKCKVMQLKEVPAGESISYGCIYTCDTPRRIATVGIGYADGLFRGASGKIDMLVRGKRAPQVGRICMDISMLDVTDIPGVMLGDTVTVFGNDGDAHISVYEIAKAAGTVSYEILCAVSPRISRVYLNH